MIYYYVLTFLLCFEIFFVLEFYFLIHRELTRPFNQLSAGWYFNLCGVWAAYFQLLFFGGRKGGQKRAFFGGPKSPILARGHMGKTAVFNQIVLYLETPNLVEYGLPPPPFR